MAIGIDELDDDDVMDVTPLQPAQYFTPQQEEEEEEEGSVLEDILKSRGISDPSRIKFEDDNGALVERDWNDLTREEQYNIINTPLESKKQPSAEDMLDEEEIDFINKIRESGMTPSQYMSLFNDEAPSLPTYKVDDLDDDSIYILDLESRVGEISDDEAAQALAIAKQNEELFKKQVEGIRKEYLEKEELLNQQQQAEAEQQQAEAYQAYSNNIIDAIDNFSSVGTLDLDFEDNDKEQLAQFMLSFDDNGANPLYSALQDPNNLVKAAWFILHGEEAFDSVADYFTNLIKLVSENQYKRGFEDGKKGNSTSLRASVVFKKNQSNTRRMTSIDDLD